MSIFSSVSADDYRDEQECRPKMIGMSCKDCGARFLVLVREVPMYWPQCEACLRKAQERAGDQA